MSDHPQLFDALPAPVEDALRASIQRFGVLVPVVRDQHGGMIDGRHRARIADELGVPYRRDVVKVRDAVEAAEIQRTLNADRRHLSGEQLREHIVFLAEQTTPQGVGRYSNNTIAQVVGVDRKHVDRTLADAVEHGTAPTLPDRRKGADGKTYPARRPTVVAGARDDKEAKRAQRALTAISDDNDEPETLTVSEAAKVVRQQVKAERVAQIAAAPVAELPQDVTFPVLLADPPWRYDYAEDTTRQIENHYPTMPIDDIAALQVPAAADAVLFMWATSPKLQEAFTVLDGWGFGYRTCMVWVKDKIGMGYYARQQHELVLIAARGNVPVPDPADRPSSVFHGPRTEHSAKPAVLHELIERMYPDYRRVELFARTARPGWTAWGNQAPTDGVA